MTQLGPGLVVRLDRTQAVPPMPAYLGRKARLLVVFQTGLAAAVLGTGTTGAADSPQAAASATPAHENVRARRRQIEAGADPGNVPQAAPLPVGVQTGNRPPRIRAADSELGAALIPGQRIEPIDLAGVLRLAGARDLDIAIARQQVLRAVADLQHARALWLPSLFLGPTWYRLDGRVQSIDGRVITTGRSSLFIGALAASPNLYAAAPPGSGFPPQTGLSSVLRFSDAILIPQAARRDLAASKADLGAATNNALLTAAEGYFDLLLAIRLLAIEREAAASAGTLAEITGSYARSGKGLPADHERILTELHRRRANIEGTVGQLEVASANLVRLLVLDPTQVLAPVEPAETVFRPLPETSPLDEMIVAGLRRRPELASAQELVQATLLRLKQARLRPLVPSPAFSYAGGGFGGGHNAFFGDLGSRGDATVSLFWELQNLGFTDRAAALRGGTSGCCLEAAQGGEPAGCGGRRRLQGPSRIDSPHGKGRGGGHQGPRIAAAESAQYPAGGRAARRDPAHRGPPADPGAGVGPNGLLERCPGL
jgi:hypothetical protein